MAKKYSYFIRVYKQYHIFLPFFFLFRFTLSSDCGPWHLGFQIIPDDKYNTAASTVDKYLLHRTVSMYFFDEFDKRDYSTRNARPQLELEFCQFTNGWNPELYDHQ
jgi:hypothetical protein